MIYLLSPVQDSMPSKAGRNVRLAAMAAATLSNAGKAVYSDALYEAMAGIHITEFGRCKQIEDMLGEASHVYLLPLAGWRYDKHLNKVLSIAEDMEKPLFYVFPKCITSGYSPIQPHNFKVRVTTPAYELWVGERGGVL